MAKTPPPVIPPRATISPAKLYFILALLVLTAFWPVLHCGFIEYDDPAYVTKNPHVIHGLTWANICWAFTSIEASNWHPLTWLSHQLDCQLYDLKPAGHHFTNLLLHLANALLVFTLLRRLTGALWRSLIVAAIFALHPLRVESVAWISERKDVLSALFFLLTLLFYFRYTQAQTASEAKKLQRSIFNVECSMFNYLLALIFFAMGLMSKPMLVTLPCILLLLDIWPLNRLKLSTLHSSLSTLLEKIPFFALALASSIITFIAQHRGGAMSTLENLPLQYRLLNASGAYLIYLGKIFYPAHLAVIYSHVGGWTMWVTISGALALILLSILACRRLRRAPWLFVGWFWFIGMLVPVSGLVQVGNQSMADRFTYLPMIGFLIALVWSIRLNPRTAACATAIAIIACFATTRYQLNFWRDTDRLFRHAVAVTQNNFIALEVLGHSEIKADHTEEGIAHLRQSLAIYPDYEEAHANLGNALAKQNNFTEALAHYQSAVKIKPTDAEVHNDIGNVLESLGQPNEARAEYAEALRLKPTFTDAHYNQAFLFTRLGQTNEAVAEYEKVIQLQPEHASAHFNLANILEKLDRIPEARDHFTAALRANPQHFGAHNNLANLLLRLHEFPEAEKHLHAAIALKPDSPQPHYILGKLHLDQGHVADAIPELNEAVRLKPNWLPALQQLAIAQSQTGDFAAATITATEGLNIARSAAQPQLAEQFQKMLDQFQSGHAVSK